MYLSGTEDTSCRLKQTNTHTHTNSFNNQRPPKIQPLTCSPPTRSQRGPGFVEESGSDEAASLCHLED